MALTKKLHRHFSPHIHNNGDQHQAHSLSLTSLFVYLQLFVIAIAGFYLVAQTAPKILGEVAFGAEQIIVLTNDKRAELGLSALTFNSSLSQAASAKASHMLEEDYWAHNSPSGRTPWNFISNADYKYLFAGENLARDFGDASSAVEAWMNSPSHRSNLLDSNFEEIGVAVTYGSLTGREGSLVVQMFGTPVSQLREIQPLAENNEEEEIETVVVDVSPLPTPVVVVQAEPEQAPGIVGQTAVLASQRFAAGKIVSLGLVALVFVLFLTEVVITLTRNHLSFRPSVVAHLVILAFILFTLWYAVGGAIL